MKTPTSIAVSWAWQIGEVFAQLSRNRPIILTFQFLASWNIMRCLEVAKIKYREKMALEFNFVEHVIDMHGIRARLNIECMGLSILF